MVSARLVIRLSACSSVLEERFRRISERRRASQLPRVHRLGEVVVRARREPRHARVELRLGGEEHHGDEVRHRVALELAAQIDPGDPRHAHVEQHQVRRLLGDLDERLLRRADVAHRVAQVLDVVPHRLPDQEVIVDDQHVPESRRAAGGRSHDVIRLLGKVRWRPDRPPARRRSRLLHRIARRNTRSMASGATPGPAA